MKKTLFLPLFLLLFSANGIAQSDIGKQLWRNFNFGWNVYRTDDYRWRNIFVGTGYTQSFKALPKAYWSLGLNVNWGKYTLYNYGSVGMGAQDAYLKTTSFSVPIYAGYRLIEEKGFGMTLYTGPSFELIASSKLDGYSFNKINRFQTGWTVGTNFRLLYLFRAGIAYSYYPISLLTNDINMPRSAFTFSLGF